MQIARLVISGLSGGSGKSLLSLGLARAYARQGLKVLACKKGPDYIDAAWLALAAGAPQCNLDPFFSTGPELRAIFADAARSANIALVEGNRGLFDGLDLQGSCSTAMVARQLDAPVLLVVDCTKMTRTTAALVQGCLNFEKGLRIAAVVLNRTGNARHREMARKAVEELAGIPVMGALPRRTEPFIMERHMGLAGPVEPLGRLRASALLDSLADFIADNVDLKALRSLAASAPPLPAPPAAVPARDKSFDESFSAAGTGMTQSFASGSALPPARTTAPPAPADPVRAERACAAPRPEAALEATADHPPRKARLGYILDAALWFYYRENLDALEKAGAELLPLSLLSADPWPELDGLYLGGGLPELYAEAICANRDVLERLKALSLDGLPMYAECGGFMVLSRALIINGRRHAMAGVFACDVEFLTRPQGLGYVEAEVLTDNPYHPKGIRFRGHEFHFSRQSRGDSHAPATEDMVLGLSRGSGMGRDPSGAGRDGLLRRNTFASYTHIYAPALPHWAPAFIGLCLKKNRGPGL